jgi:hypothetical protein
MALDVSTVVVIALLIAALAICLFVIGALRNGTADNLGDCVQNMKTIRYQAAAIWPAVSVAYLDAGRRHWTAASNRPGRRRPADSHSSGAAGEWLDPQEPLRWHLDPNCLHLCQTQLGCYG